MDLIFSSLSGETRWVVALGALIVIWFASYQYRHWTGDEPEKPDNPPRHYTTFVRFYFFGLVYVAIFLTAFVILIAMPQQIISSLKAQAKGIEPAMNLLGALADPRFIFAVLFLTTASTNIPIIVKWEKIIRKTLHDLAKTPSYVRDSVNYLMRDYKNSFTARVEDIKLYFESNQETIRYLYDQCFPEKTETPINDASLIKDTLRSSMDRLTYLWLEINFLRWRVRQIAPEGNSTSCMTTCKNQYDLFEKNYEKLRPDVELYYLAKATHPASDNLLKRLEKEVTQRAEAQLRELLTVICCGIYATQRTKADRARALEEMRLSTQIVGLEPVNWTPILEGILLVFISALLATAFYYNLAPAQEADAVSANAPVPLNWGSVLLWAVVVTLIHGFAVIVAIFFSRQMSPGTSLPENISNLELIRKKLKAGFWAAFLTGLWSLLLLLSLVAHPALRKMIPEMADKYNLWIAFNLLWPWCLIPLVTAAFTVIHREDAIAKKIKGGFKPLANRAAAQALATFAMGSLATLVFLGDQVFDIESKRAFFIYAAAISLLVGGALGWVIPGGYRESIEKKEKELAKLQDFTRQAPAMGV